MWLINTDEYTLHEIQGPDEDHPYAILSHTWEESIDDSLQKEVTFRDMSNLSEARKKTGWSKIERTCALAKSYEPSLDWAWIDTCCIDKSSSSELSEAINSMFSWYKQAKVCFVYLSDLRPSPTVNLDTRSSRDQMRERFPGCHWFKRGWTLQELIAPKEVEFYDETWRKRGTKKDLGRLITQRTGIDQAVLNDSENLSSVPVGRRMSWISDRSTKRVEDIAYCLYGIFDVNIPLVYGEGEKAFIQLQTTIAQQNNDLSLFAWSIKGDDEHEVEAQMYHGIFAKSHRYFASCKHLVSLQDPLILDRTHFTVTNRGLEFQAALVEDHNEGDYIMSLFCQNRELELTNGKPALLVIRLVKTLQGFVRHRANRVPVASEMYETHVWPGKLKSVQVPMDISLSNSRRLEKRLENAFRFRAQTPSNVCASIRCSLGYPTTIGFRRDFNLEAPTSWDIVNNTFLTGGYPISTGMVWFKLSFADGTDGTWSTNHLRIMFGFTASTSERRLSDTEPAVGLKPWLVLTNGGVENIENQSESTAALITKLNKYIDQKESYGPTISALGHDIRQNYDLSRLPKATILTPSFYADDKWQDGEKHRLTVSLEDTTERGVVIHEVIIRLEPVNLAGGLPIREIRRSRSISRMAY